MNRTYMCGKDSDHQDYISFESGDFDGFLTVYAENYYGDECVATTTYMSEQDVNDLIAEIEIMRGKMPQPNVNFTPGQEPEVIFDQPNLVAPKMMVVSEDWVNSMLALCQLAPNSQALIQIANQLRTLKERAK